MGESLQELFEDLRNFTAKVANRLSDNEYYDLLDTVNKLELKSMGDESSEEDYPKDIEGKLPISLVPPEIITEIAKVREYGTNKYRDPENWRRVSVKYYIDALLRHTLQFWENPKSIDEESGLPHYSHMACNLAFIIDMLEKEKEQC